MTEQVDSIIEKLTATEQMLVVEVHRLRTVLKAIADHPGTHYSMPGYAPRHQSGMFIAHELCANIARKGLEGGPPTATRATAD